MYKVGDNMNLKITSYIHGIDKNTVASINLIFLLDAKTIGTMEFKNDNCAITVYDNKEESLNLMLHLELLRKNLTELEKFHFLHIFEEKIQRWIQNDIKIFMQIK